MGDNMDKISINSVPEPFRSFLDSTYSQEISATSLGGKGNAATNDGGDMQDLLFLAAILMLCDGS